MQQGRISKIYPSAVQTVVIRIYLTLSAHQDKEDRWESEDDKLQTVHLQKTCRVAKRVFQWP